MKRSKEETQETINTILDTAFRQLLSGGFERMSYTSLSEESGISRTGICHHFGKKTKIPLQLKDRLLHHLLQNLDFSADIEVFRTSWVCAMQEQSFRDIWRVAYQLHINEQVSDIITLFNQALQDKCEVNFGQNCQQEIVSLMGYTLLRLHSLK